VRTVSLCAGCLLALGSLTARPLRATLAGAAGTTSAGAATPLERFCRLAFRAVTRKALRLPV
jgi:hypothetical protein